MENIDKEYKKRFSNQKIEEGNFNSNELWKDISDSLSAPTALPIKPWWSTKLILFPIVMCTIAGLILVKSVLTKDTRQTSAKNKIETQILSANENEPQQNRVVASEEKKLTKPDEETIKISSSLNAKPSRKELSDNILNDIERKSNAQSIKNSNVNLSRNYVDKIHATRQETDDNAAQISNENNVEISQSNDRSNIAYPARIEKSNTQSNLNAEEFENAERDQEILTFLIQPKAQLLVPTAKKLPTLSNKHESVIPIKKNSPELRLSVIGGANKLLGSKSFEVANIEGLLVESVQEGRSGQYGYNVGVNFSALFKDTWVLNTGIENHRLYSLFDYAELGSRVLLEDQVLAVWLDQNTGERVSTITGDTLAFINSARNIKHYNSFSQIVVPLDFGIQKEIRNLVFGLNAGLNLNFVRSQSGKEIDPTSFEVVSFDKDSEFAPLNSFHLGYRLNALIGYSIMQKWTLALQPQLLWNPNAQRVERTLVGHPYQLNFNLGLHYALN